MPTETSEATFAKSNPAQEQDIADRMEAAREEAKAHAQDAATSATEADESEQAAENFASQTGSTVVVDGTDTGIWSALERALEAKRWATQTGSTVTLAGGTDTGKKSAKAHAQDAGTSASQAAASESDAEAASTQAQAAAESVEPVTLNEQMNRLIFQGEYDDRTALFDLDDSKLAVNVTL